jgi:type IV secretion system protein TrbL
MMDDIMTKAEVSSAGWMTRALEYAKNLFFGLAAIEFAWSAIQLTLKKSELSEIMAATLFKVMSLAFFAMVLIKAPEWIPTIMSSFKAAGAGVGGAAALSPSSVFDQGLGLAGDLMKFSNDAAPSTGRMALNTLTGSGQGLGKFMLSAIIMGISSVFIVLGYGLIAVQLLITIIESYIIIGGGAIMLGFSGSRWTHNLSEKYFGYAISVGAKLFTIYLIIGFGESFTQALKDTIAASYAAKPDEGPSFGDYLGIGGASLLYGAVGYMVPGLAGSMLNGSVSMSLQNTGAAAGMVAGAPVSATLAAGAAGARAIGMAAGGVASLLPVQKAAGAVGGSPKNDNFTPPGGISGYKPAGGGGVTGSPTGNFGQGGSPAANGSNDSPGAKNQDPAGSVRSASGDGTNPSQQMSMQETHDAKKIEDAPQDKKITAADKQNSAQYQQSQEGKSAEEIRASASNTDPKTTVYPPSQEEEKNRTPAASSFPSSFAASDGGAPQGAALNTSSGQDASFETFSAGSSPTTPPAQVTNYSDPQSVLKQSSSVNPIAPANSGSNQSQSSANQSNPSTRNTSPASSNVSATPVSSAPSGSPAAGQNYGQSSPASADNSRPAFVDPKFNPNVNPQDPKSNYRNETGGMTPNQPPQVQPRFDEQKTNAQKAQGVAQKFNRFAEKLQYAADRRKPHLSSDGNTGSAHGLRSNVGD